MNYQLLKSVAARLGVFGLMFAMFLSGGQIALAQKASIRAARATQKAVNDVQIQSASASTDGTNGVLLEWQSSYEIGNFGYYVNRVTNGEVERIGDNLIPGSAFTVGERVPMYAGNFYSFFDENGSPDSVYIIEIFLADQTRRSFKVQTQFDANTLSRANQRSDNEVVTHRESLQNGADDRQPRPILSSAEPSSDAKSRRNAPANSNLASDSIKQRWVAAQPGVKFAVKQNGLYRVTQPQLAASGFDVSVPTANWQLYMDGIEQAFIITGDNNGGVLGTTGYIEFYGYNLETVFTDFQTFYLVNGTVPGRRMPIFESRGYASKTVAPSFSTYVQCRNQPFSPAGGNCTDIPTIYLSQLLNGEGENFFGQIVETTPSNFKFNVPFVDMTAPNVVVEVSLHGFTSGAHNINFSLNGTQIGNITASGSTQMRQNFTAPMSLMLEGNNIVTATASTGVSVTEYVRIRYPRRYATATDRLTFTTSYNRAVRVDGFSSSSVRVFDVTDNRNVGLFNHQLTQDGSTYSASVLTSRPRVMYAVTDSAVLTPQAITQQFPSSLNTTAVNKNLLIVSHKNFLSAANNLKTYRESQGLTVAVADVEDVYDEFSFGAATPLALKAFFQQAAPGNVLLIGDASSDPKNYLNRNLPNLVPSMVTDTAFDEVHSDELLGDADTDPNAAGYAISEFPIGRFSVRDNASAQVMVNKTINFEQTLPADPYSRGAYFISDDHVGYTFSANNIALIAEMPAGTTVQQTIAEGRPDTTGIRTEIVSRVSAGPYIIGYAGHGSLTSWSSRSILRPAEVNAFTNAGGATIGAANNKLSMFILLTCLNGTFGEVSSESLAETMTKNPNGGGVMVWASSGRTIADGQDAMAKKFYQLLAPAPAGTRLGSLTQPAKMASFDIDVRKSWILFGDPTLKIK